MSVTNLSNLILGKGAPAAPGYNELMWRCAWIFASVCIVAYASFLYFGSISSAYDDEKTLIMQDVLMKPGEHHISGVIHVPSSCHGVTLKTEQRSESDFVLAFTTWQEPSRTCEPHEESRSFNTIIFGPSFGVTFAATLDGRDIPIQIQKRQ